MSIPNSQLATDCKPPQRRSNFRVGATPDARLSIKAWKIPRFAILRDKPKASAEVRMTLHDISAGGMAIIMQTVESQGVLCEGDRLRIVLKIRGDELLLDGSIKYLQPHGASAVRAGVEFRKLDATVEGRRGQSLLSSVVVELQRDQIKRAADTQTTPSELH